MLIGDKGFSGAGFLRDTAELGILFVRPDRRNEARHHGNLGGIGQLIESVYDTLKDQLDLEDHGARTATGVYARIAQRLLAMAAAIWHNRIIGAPTTRSLTAYDH